MLAGESNLRQAHGRREMRCTRTPKFLLIGENSCTVGENQLIQEQGSMRSYTICRVVLGLELARARKRRNSLGARLATFFLVSDSLFQGWRRNGSWEDIMHGMSRTRLLGEAHA